MDGWRRRRRQRLYPLRFTALTEPLAERTRPAAPADIVGPAERLRALTAALCGPNPQPVLIDGPRAVGKTAAVRPVLEAAKANPRSPFREDARFVAVDAPRRPF